MKDRKLKIFILLVFLVSFGLRFYGIADNHPFWVDEFYTASQANVLLKHGLSAFGNPKVYTEYHNIIPHFLVSVFFKLFGREEMIARLPFVLIGSLVPLAVFLLAEHIFDLGAAISASLLTVFSYLEIAWSRQARGYVIQQLLALLTIYFYLRFINKRKWSLKRFVILAFFFVLGILNHITYFLLIMALTLHFIVFNLREFRQIFRQAFSYVFLVFFILLLYWTGAMKMVTYSFSSDIFGANNFWYYHSFLWREYSLLSFLSLIGLLVGLQKRRVAVATFVIYSTIHLLFLSFIFKPYVSRYLLPIFPFLFILSGYALTRIGQLIFNRKHVVFPILLSLFIVANGHKFVNRPRSFYSVNHDFREIALLDYDRIYNLVGQKIKRQKQTVAIIETLPDRALWYLGYDYRPVYLFRWGKIEGFVNGLPKRTRFSFNRQGEKVLLNTDLRLVTEVDDLERIIRKYPHGFMFIDDASMPQDVIEYAQKNFRKELYLEHYPLDDNPYSIWPATLYSWGME